MSNHIHIHLNSLSPLIVKTRDAVAKVEPVSAFGGNLVEWTKKYPQSARLARLAEENGDAQYAKDIRDGKVPYSQARMNHYLRGNDSKTKDALSLAEAERELKNEIRLIEVFKKSGKQVPNEMIQRQKMLEEEVEKAKIKFGDADNKFVTKMDIRLPNHPAFGNRAGKVMPSGTVVYKTGPLYRPWWSKESEGVLRLNPSDVVSEKTVSGDAIGETFPTLAAAKAKVEKLADMGIRAKVNQEVDEATKKMYFIVVRLTGGDAGFTEYNPREVARLKDQLKKADNDLASGKLNPGQHSKLVESIEKELKGFRG